MLYTSRGLNIPAGEIALSVSTTEAMWVREIDTVSNIGEAYSWCDIAVNRG